MVLGSSRWVGEMVCVHCNFLIMLRDYLVINNKINNSLLNQLRYIITIYLYSALAYLSTRSVLLHCLRLVLANNILIFSILINNMKSVCHLLRSSFSTSKIPLALTYPYQYTLIPDQFAFMDIRFTEIPLNRQLAKPQKQHIHLVLKRFQQLLNRQQSEKELDRQYILNILKRKVRQLKDIQKEACFQLKFDFKLDSVVKSSGYYQIKPKHNVSLAEQDIEQIHNYKFNRQKEILDVILKPKKEVLSSEEQLKKDILSKMQNPSKEVIEQLKNMKISKSAKVFDKVLEGVLSIGKKEAKTAKFQSFYIVDQIKGVMECSMKHEGQIYKQDQIQFDTKWIYHVNNLESEDLKKYRRKTLFDFQFWNRGSIFPVRNFARQIQELQEAV